MKKGMLIGLAAGLGAIALAIPSSGGAASASACGGFKVLHNDRIGNAILPAGTYSISGRRGLTCSKAASLFTRFLEDYDGVLPHQWVAIPKGNGKAAFRRPGKRFRVALGGGRGGSVGTSRVGHLCPGNFHVLHNDRIGPISFPAGYYQIYIPRGAILGCGKAADKFKDFLNRPDGSLPKSWKVQSARAVFYRAINPRQRRFRVDPGT
jgi:hypothetical protein